MSEFRPDRKSPTDVSPAEKELLLLVDRQVCVAVETYFTAAGKIDTERGVVVDLAQNIDGIECVAKTQRKNISSVRRNEDVVAVGIEAPMYLVADGVTGRGYNISALMGETVAIIARAQMEKLEQQQAAAAVIEAALKNIPKLSRLALDSVIKKMPASIATALKGIPAHEFATTLDMVYVARHLETVFGLHIGNGRTYCLEAQPEADPYVTQLTYDHDDDGGRLASCVVLDQGSVTECEVFQRKATPGLVFITVDDGIYRAYEASEAGRSFTTYLRALDVEADRPIDAGKLLRSLSAAMALQSETTKDDAACALLGLPK